MKRKLIQQGNKALTLTIPAKWLHENNLSRGSEIEILQEASRLILSTDRVEKKKEYVLNLTKEKSNLIRVHLNNLYRLGYTKITVSFTNKEQEKVVHKLVDDFLLGFEITGKKKSKLVLENVTEPSSERQKVILRRIFLLVKESFSLLENKMNKFSKQSNDEIEDITNKVSRYDNFNRRNIIKNQSLKGKNFFYWELYLQLTLIQFSLYRLNSELSGAPISSKTKESFTKTSSYFSRLYEDFFSKNEKNISEINEQIHFNLSNEIRKQMNKNKEARILYRLAELSRHVNLMTSPIFAIFVSEAEEEK